MSGITKGSILEEVSPYAVVPLYYDTRTSSDGAVAIVSKCRIDTDPTRVPGLEDLPRFNVCQIWHQNHANHIFDTPEIKKFLRRARRMASSSSDNVVASWQILCILAILRVVKDNACNMTDTKQTNSHQKTSEFTQQSTGTDKLVSQWWSPLLLEHYDDDKERKMIPNDDCDDDDGSLLVELWPLIREYIPWLACQRLYRRIQNRLHVLTIAHPLKAWAQTTLFKLTDDEFGKSWRIFQKTSVQETGTETEKIKISSSPNRLRASKLWLDRVANIPERLVGVLIEDPSKALGGIEPKSDSTPSSSNEDIRFSTALTLPRCYQSCLPNSCLELHVVTAIKNTRDNSTEPNTAGSNSSAKIRCRWIALYDLSSSESEHKNRSLSTMPTSRECDFFDADGKTKTPSPEINAENLAQARRLAHSHFFKEAFGDAVSLYQECHDYCASSEDTNSIKSQEAAEWKVQAESDLWHAMGAVILSQQKFATAQEHWKNGSRYQCIHKQISEQLEKQRAYQYFDPLVEPYPRETIRQFKKQIIKNETNATVNNNQSIFVASEVIDIETCHKLVAWAKDYALDNGGWTASRHYAVPTTDLPIHKVPKLSVWFREWMPKILFPLLQDQFGNTGCDNKRFYVHDAFLVRYEATSSSCFLPLHFDESTHSCILALNDEFDGGGSYFYDLDQSIALEMGGLVSFLGNQCLHGGNPVTRGVRYILAIFLFQDRDLACNSSEEEKSETNGTKRGDGAISKESIISKRPKKDDGKQSDQGGRFSFSFF